MTATLPIALALSIASGATNLAPPDTIVAFACYERYHERPCPALDPLVIHDNTAGDSFFPDTRGQAISLAERLIGAGHSLDLGIMQINVANLSHYNLSIPDAFVPARSMAVGAEILSAAYKTCSAAFRGAVDAMRCVAEHYNTGRHGTATGRKYAAGVFRVAANVPSIKEVIAHDFAQAAPITNDGGARPDESTQGGANRCAQPTDDDGWHTVARPQGCPDEQPKEPEKSNEDR